MAVSDAELVAHLVQWSQVSLLVPHRRPAHRGGKRALLTSDPARPCRVESTALTKGMACLREGLGRTNVFLAQSC